MSTVPVFTKQRQKGLVFHASLDYSYIDHVWPAPPSPQSEINISPVTRQGFRWRDWNTNPATKPRICAACKTCHRLWERPTTDWSSLREPTTDTTWRARTQRLDIWDTELNTTGKQSMRWFLMMFCYSRRLVPSPVVFREVSPSNWQKQMQRPTSKH